MNLDKFVNVAIDVYKSLLILADDSEYIAVGDWLIELQNNHGWHPNSVRCQLETARAAGKIYRYTQGSTPDTRFQNKHFVDNETGEKIYFYHGDWLLPGKASVSIKLEKKQG